jgi:hypothetical protein
MPYTIAVPVDGQRAFAGTFGIPVRDAILDLDTRVSQAEVEQQRVLARGQRITSKTNITTTEVGILRVDDIPVVAGYMYRISSGGINADITSAGPAAADETFSFFCRAAFSATTGTAATTSSPSIGKIRFPVNSISQGPIIPLTVFYYASTDGYISVLISGIRQSGTQTFQAFADASNPIDLTVEYAGVDPGDTGVDL